jgi:hypothetical protein
MILIEGIRKHPFPIQEGMMAEKTTQTRASTTDVLYQTGIMIFILAFVLLAYTCIHEGGHAIMGVLFGGTLTEFNANFLNLSAHVGIRGEFSSIQNAVISAAGVSLPLVVWAFFVLLTPAVTNPVLQMLRFISGISAINSLLAWIVIPLLVMGGQMPGDDSVNFLRYTQIYPPLVSGAAGLVYAGGWLLLFHRMGGWKNILQILRQPTQTYRNPTSLRTLAILSLIFTGAAAGAVFLNGQSSGNASTLPKEYVQVAAVSLADEAIHQKAAYAFTLEQATKVSFFFIVPNLPNGPAEIALVGSGNYENLFFRAPQSFQGGGTVNPTEIPLEPGEYQILLTFPKMNGQVDVGRK